MAGALVAGAVVGDGVSKLSDVIIHAIKHTWLFKDRLTQIQGTITRYRPNFIEMEKLTRVLDRGIQETEMFSDLLKRGEILVLKCERIKWKIWKKYTHSIKLDNFNASLVKFCQIDVQLMMARGLLDLQVAKQMRLKKGDPGRWLSGVPLLKQGVIGFDHQVTKLKAMVLRDSAGDDCSVVVVSAAVGCGKTTLVTKLCHDSDIQGQFGRNIYFVTISETPNLKIVIKNLLGKKEADFINEDDAINQWGSFLRGNGSEILLVLDDVCSDSIIKQFKFKYHGYKILATSRTTYRQFSTYSVEPLSDPDATTLFRQFAFSESESENNDIPDDLVDKLVKCCKNRPMVLSVIGDLLNGRHLISWVAMLNNLSNEQQPFLDSYEVFLFNQEPVVVDTTSTVKQLILDMGLYPDDEEVSPKMLMDKWVHLSNHVDQKPATTNNFFQRYFNKPAILSPIRNSTSSSSLMAGAAPLGAGLGLGDAVSRLSDAIIDIENRTPSKIFRIEFNEITEYINRNKPFFDEIDKIIEVLDRPKHEKERFIDQLKHAETLVLDCEHIGYYNVYRRYLLKMKLERLTTSLWRFCEVDAPWVVGKGILDLLVARDLQKRYDRGTK